LGSGADGDELLRLAQRWLALHEAIGAHLPGSPYMLEPVIRIVPRP
jgi:hypothetical protein